MVDIASNSTAYYVRQTHFDSDRMAGTVANWKNNGSPKTQSSDIAALSIANNGTDNFKITAPSISFGEILDIINPLQHIPVVSNYYRSFTGDDISPVARIAGGTLYGGPIGGVASLANAAIEEHSGEDFSNALISGTKSKHAYHNTHDECRTAGLNADYRSEDIVDAVKTPKQNSWNFNT